MEPLTGGGPARWAVLGLIGGLSVAGYGAWAALGDAPRSTYLVLFAGLFALYLPACYLVLRWGSSLPARPTMGLLVAVAVLGRAVLVDTTPRLSDDVYRYVWDGRVQAAGLSPYAYPPAAPQLAALHPPGDPIWSRINRKPVITIYPPGTELFFAAVYRLAPDSVPAMKAVLVTLDLLSCLVLLRLLAVCGLPPARVLVYAWAPLPIVEFGSSGHIEALEVLLTLLALLAGMHAWGRAGRPQPGAALAAGAALAGAALVKLIPLLLLVAWHRRPGPKLIAWSLGLFVAASLAYVVAYGGTLPVFLVTYLRDEYVNAPVYAILAATLVPLGVPDTAIRGALFLALVGAAFAIARLPERGPDAFLGKSFLLVVAYLALATSAHPWYATWLLLFLPLLLPPGGRPLLGGAAGADPARRRTGAYLPALVALLYTGVTVWGGYPVP